MSKNKKKTNKTRLVDSETDKKIPERVERVKRNTFSDLPDRKLNTSQFSMDIATLDSERVVPRYRRLVENKLLQNPIACFKKLQSLGYSKELADNNISIKENDKNTKNNKQNKTEDS